jgi:hypothetical protein
MSERQKAALVVDDDVARHGVELAVALRLKLRGGLCHYRSLPGSVCDLRLKVPHILEGSDRISISLW